MGEAGSSPGRASPASGPGRQDGHPFGRRPARPVSSSTRSPQRWRRVRCLATSFVDHGVSAEGLPWSSRLGRAACALPMSISSTAAASRLLGAQIGGYDHDWNGLKLPASTETRASQRLRLLWRPGRAADDLRPAQPRWLGRPRSTLHAASRSRSCPPPSAHGSTEREDATEVRPACRRGHGADSRPRLYSANDRDSSLPIADR